MHRVGTEQVGLDLPDRAPLSRGQLERELVVEPTDEPAPDRVLHPCRVALEDRLAPQ